MRFLFAKQCFYAEFLATAQCLLLTAPNQFDRSDRVQTVNAPMQPLYARLLRTFEQRTGVPVLLNNSFNEQEPIVCAPREAVECLLRTQMDGLAIGSFVIRRTT